MINIKNLEVYINKKPLVKSINLKINQGQVFALAGESGSGKSLTALSIPNLLKFIGNFEVNGQVEFEGKNLLEQPEAELQKIRGSEIGVIFQDPQTSLNPLHTIYKQIKEVLQLHNKFKPDALHARVLELLSLVELDVLKDRLNALPHELSGGQRQRVMIAMAIANNPKLLIADEPTTALDVTIQKEVLELIQKLQKQMGMAVLLITHDMNLIKKYADNVAIMQFGQIIEQGSVEQIFNSPQTEYTKFLINSEPKRSKPYSSFASEPIILQTQNLNVKYTVKKNFFGKPIKQSKALKNLNLNLHKGQTIGVVGESGSGKSTLAKAILKLVNATGNVVYNGQQILSLPEKHFRPQRKNIQIVFQDPFSSLNPRMSVHEIILEGLIAHNLIDDKTEQKLEQLLIKLGLDATAQHRYPHEFSGGQRQRIGLARSLILEPEIIIFDEPTSALDLVTQSQILEILQKFQSEQGLSYIFISHDLKVIKAIADYIIVMKDGDVVEQGDVEQIFNLPKTDYAKALISASF